MEILDRALFLRGSNGKQVPKYVLVEQFKPYLDAWLKQREEKGIESPWLFVTMEDGKYVQATVSQMNTYAEKITTVGGSSFKDCTSLTTVTIADGVQYIETAAFNGCTALSEITIPESVTYIKAGAFKDCNALTSVTIRSNCRMDLNVFPATVEINRYE